MADLLREGNDFYVDPKTRDFVSASPDVDTSQRITERLRSFAREWILDDEGLPYFTEIFGKGINLRAAYALILETIVSTRGVSSVEEFDVFVDPVTRQMVVNARVLASFGGTIDISETLLRPNDPFLRDELGQLMEDLAGDPIQDLR